MATLRFKPHKLDNTMVFSLIQKIHFYKIFLEWVSETALPLWSIFKKSHSTSSDKYKMKAIIPDWPKWLVADTKQVDFVQIIWPNKKQKKYRENQSMWEKQINIITKTHD